ncbi:MAG: hypothetical protein R6T96_13620 [Longimicrobiales bacterium]
MDTKRIAAIVLILLGVLGLVLGQFAFGRETHHASVGPMEMSVTEQRTVNIPIWVGVGAIVVGAALLLPLGKSRG